MRNLSRWLAGGCAMVAAVAWGATPGYYADAFDFEDLETTEPGVEVSSNVITVSGINVPCRWEISGQGTPVVGVRVNGGPAQYATTGPVVNGDRLQLLWTSGPVGTLRYVSVLVRCLT